MVARIQDQGVAAVVALLNKPYWLQWGTGSGKASNANMVTGSGTEPRTAASVSQAGNSLIIAGTIVAALSGARNITEVGVFDSAGASAPPSGGNMIFYADFVAQAITTAGQQIYFEFHITF